MAGTGEATPGMVVVTEAKRIPVGDHEEEVKDPILVFTTPSEAAEWARGKGANEHSIGLFLNGPDAGFMRGARFGISFDGQNDVGEDVTYHLYPSIEVRGKLEGGKRRKRKTLRRRR